MNPLILLDRIGHRRIGLLCLLLILTGLLFSRAAMSIGMIGLAVNAVFNIHLSDNWRAFRSNQALIALSLVFFLFLITGLYSSNTEWLVDRLRMKLPFLFLPFGIAAIPRLDRQAFYAILYLFFWIIVALCLWSLSHYLDDFQQITYNYRLGKVMPTPVMHIRFSLMVAFSVAIGWYLFRRKYWVWKAAERPILLMATIFLFLYLHLLAVRSGLLSVYLVLAVIVIDEVLRSRRYMLGVSVAVVLLVGALLATRYVPTIKNKLDYTRYSLQLFRSKSGLADLSDSYRLATVEAGIALGNRHWLTGVGIGDIRDETQSYLQEHYPSLAASGFMPQSQYVLVYAAAGLFGLLFFIWATLYPLWYRQSYRDGLLVAFHLIALLSFLVEQTLETQIGTAFYLLFALLGICDRAGEPIAPKPIEHENQRHHHDLQ